MNTVGFSHINTELGREKDDKGVSLITKEVFAKTYKEFYKYFQKQQTEFEFGDPVSAQVFANHREKVNAFMSDSKRKSSVNETAHFVTQMSILDYINDKEPATEEAGRILRSEFQNLKGYEKDFKEQIIKLVGIAEKGEHPLHIKMTRSQKGEIDKLLKGLFMDEIPLYKAAFGRENHDLAVNSTSSAVTKIINRVLSTREYYPEPQSTLDMGGFNHREPDRKVIEALDDMCKKFNLTANQALDMLDQHFSSLNDISYGSPGYMHYAKDIATVAKYKSASVVG